MAKPAKGLISGNASLADDEAAVTARATAVGSGSFVVPKGAPAPGDDPVNHPPQYTQGKVECIDAIDSAVTELPPDEAVCVANVIKYVWRYRRKSPVESLKKARWYLDRLIGKMETRYAECLPAKGEPIHVDVQHRI